MAAKYQHDQALAPSSIMPRSDAENPDNRQYSEHIRKRKRTRCFASVAILAVFLIVVALILALTLGPVRSPKVRLEDVVVASSNSPSGDLRFAARVVIKNRNFGRYKFDDTYATVRSGNGSVGQFLISEGRARARSTKKRAVAWDIRASNSSSGSMDLTIEAELRGKIEVVRVIRRRKSGRMNCSMSVDLGSRIVRNLRCN